MGLNQYFLQSMAWLKQEGYLDHTRRVIELGRQQLNDEFLAADADIRHLCALFGIAVPSLPRPRGRGPQLPSSAPYSKAFYEGLGLQYDCIDIDGSDAIPLDLNFDDVPASLRGQFGLVTNFGTTEHVMNQMNAFKVVHDLAAAGGIMIHELPAQGTLNHGFFAYQPKFFERLAASNGYGVLFMDFRWAAIERGLPSSVKLAISKYVDVRNRAEYGASPAALFVVLRKAADKRFAVPMDA